MKPYQLEVSEDEALVVFEFFWRLQDTDRLEFSHPAEDIALLRLCAQFDKTMPAMFDPHYEQLLADARARISDGFEGEVPGLSMSNREHG